MVFSTNMMKALAPVIIKMKDAEIEKRCFGALSWEAKRAFS